MRMRMRMASREMKKKEGMISKRRPRKRRRIRKQVEDSFESVWLTVTGT